MNPVRRDVVSIGESTDNVTIRFETNNEGPWILHWFVNISITTQIIPIILTFNIQPYRLAFQYVRNNIIRKFFGRHFTEMACFRGLAIVLAEDVPAIAKTVPPGNSTYCPVYVTS